MGHIGSIIGNDVQGHWSHSFVNTGLPQRPAGGDNASKWRLIAGRMAKGLTGFEGRADRALGGWVRFMGDHVQADELSAKAKGTGVLKDVVFG